MLETTTGNFFTVATSFINNFVAPAFTFLFVDTPIGSFIGAILAFSLLGGLVYSFPHR